MKRRIVLFSMAAMLAHRVAVAGSWGHGIFDNDGALDWVGEFLEKPSTALVESALGATLKSGPIDSFMGESALAAAEIVAASLGKPAQKMPDELRAWLQRAELADYRKLKGLAVRAVRTVLSAEKSELREMWSLHLDDLSLWRSHGVALLKRLGESMG
ncbi:uncharacterized protein DUF4259 [Roseateles depolymerans]|uniref:Uncharacterized protein n=2 Tax=Roseateles depolymerans TaxID=76731 RepID=A0A0U3LS41_9BURK|nr:hypothetical protein RD2015_3406 [Roseateles depolymerans]REG21916.1 uncharacterized protein DUF4259 [Roseateles depolymerans]